MAGLNFLHIFAALAENSRWESSSGIAAVIADLPGIGRDARRSAKLINQSNSATRRVVVHDIVSDNGDHLKISEKEIYHDRLRFRTSADVFFYEKVLPLLPEAADFAPRLLRVERGLVTCRIFISYIDGRTARVPEDFILVMDTIARFQAGCRACNADPALQAEPFRRYLSYFSKPIKQRFHGNFPLYLKTLRRQAIAKSYLPTIAVARLLRNLRVLTDFCAGLPETVSHLDLLSMNICLQNRRPVFIDWGEMAFAPAGFDYGCWLYSAFRSATPEDFSCLIPAFWKRLDQLAGSESRAALRWSACYFYAVSGLRFLANIEHLRQAHDCLDSLNAKVEAFFRSIEALSSADISLDRPDVLT